LFNLTVWIEEKIGHNIDPSCVDIVTDWDSVRKVLQFVQRNSAGIRPATISPTRAQARPLPEAEYEIVRYGPKHKSAIAELQTQLWSSDLGRNIRYLEWKYERNPFRDDIIIYLAFP